MRLLTSAIAFREYDMLEKLFAAVIWLTAGFVSELLLDYAFMFLTSSSLPQLVTVPAQVIIGLFVLLIAFLTMAGLALISTQN